MTLTNQRGGSSPERGRGLSSRSISSEKLQIYKKIGIAACDFLMKLNPKSFLTSPQNIQTQTIVDRSLARFFDRSLKFPGDSPIPSDYVDLSLDPKILELRRLELKRLADNPNFNSGFVTMKLFFPHLRRYIDKREGLISNSVRVTIAGMEFDKNTFESEFIKDIRGLKATRYVYNVFQEQGSTTPERKDTVLGGRFGTILHWQHVVSHTEPYLNRLSTLKY